MVDPTPSPEAVHTEHQEAIQRQKALAAALNVLGPRERGIFEARYLTDPSAKLEELSKRYGVSRERVRQIEMHAFDEVRTAVRVEAQGAQNAIAS